MFKSFKNKKKILPKTSGEWGVVGVIIKKEFSTNLMKF